MPTRRAIIAGAISLDVVRRLQPAQSPAHPWTLPIGRPGRVPGDGFRIGHGFATQNTWFYPDGWHTGEDWYALDGTTAGAEVSAVADGDIVYANYDYPGRVVIVRHADDLFSMYGHLDAALRVESGPVSRGQVPGTVLDRNDGRAPSHLHFEVRRFLTEPEVNGPSPRYGFTCGPDCPPGPGYWPIDAPEHPVAMGWLNPLHVILARAFLADVDGMRVVVAEGAGQTAPVMAAPDGDEPVGELLLAAGEEYEVVEVDVGAADGEGTSGKAYRAWFRLRLLGGPDPAWVQAVVPDAAETGADGRPSSVRLVLLPLPLPGDGM